MSLIILQDHREKKGKHDLVEQYLKQQGITLRRVRLNVGDYMFPNGEISCDLKKDCEELASDLYRDKLAFNKKYKKCLKDGIQLIVLVEEKVNNLNELVAWKSKHSRINGRLLLDMIHTIQVSYGVKFVFCDKNDTPIKLLELLGANKNENWKTYNGKY